MRLIQARSARPDDEGTSLLNMRPGLATCQVPLGLSRTGRAASPVGPESARNTHTHTGDTGKTVIQAAWPRPDRRRDEDAERAVALKKLLFHIIHNKFA